MHVVVRCFNNRDICVSTTGMLSRELFEYRAKLGLGHERDFLTVGSMGHASSIALGVALFKPNRQVKGTVIYSLLLLRGNIFF